MIKVLISALLCFVIIFLGIFLLSCEKKYITQATEEHVPEYHMVFSSVTGEGYPDTDQNYYVITINTKTHEIIDSIAYQESSQTFDELVFIDKGNKALKLGYQTVYLEDVLTYDTLALVNKELYHLFVSSDEKYLAADGARIYIYSLPDLNLIDSVQNIDLLPIGIDGENNVLFAFNRDTSLVYSIKFSFSPAETTIVDIVYWNTNPSRKILNGFLSPNNKTLLLNCEEAYDSYNFYEYDADGLYYIAEIQNKYLVAPEWTSDGKTCYGKYDGGVAKYNTQAKIYSIIINRNDVFSFDYWVEEWGFYVADIQLTSNDELIFIQTLPRCGEPCIGFNGHTLVYDLQMREFVYRYEYSVAGENLMRLNPRDWSI